jgi:hypothetical protein
MGPTALLPLRRKACWWFFRPKNPTALAGCEPANWGTKGQHATPRPPKPLICMLVHIKTSLRCMQSWEREGLWLWTRRCDGEKLQLRSVLLCSVQWQFITDVSRQPTGLIFKGLLLGFLHPWRWDQQFFRNVCKELRCVITQKSTDFIHFAAKPEIPQIQLIPSNRILRKSFLSSIKGIPSSYGYRNFSTVFTGAQHWSTYLT